ncbi:MAG: diadenylate cyclase CdaA [Candidatus Zixiibacteriota bacterium]|nr:MAG: diadenylate cyclase CdaA [candidate division Zixibacteria bacterium]
MTLFKIDFLSVTLIDLIDIIIISYFFYRVLLFLKEARSTQITIVLFIVFTVGFLAFWIDLSMVKWIFSNVFIAGVIIMAVLFQPELRGALSKLSKGKFVRYIIKTKSSDVVDEIVMAVSKLADMHYGALIVLERTVKLKSILETGKPLNSHLTHELLQTIFTPYTPLHDGAVVIRGDTALAASCTLPLSQNPAYHRLHGMRHKAGVGVTEDSDALVVIVSEETGQISYALEGNLHRDINPQELGKILTEHFNQGK